MFREKLRESTEIAQMPPSPSQGHASLPRVCSTHQGCPCVTAAEAALTHHRHQFILGVGHFVALDLNFLKIILVKYHFFS